MPRPLGSHVFPPTGTIFKLIQDIIGTSLLTKFHDDLTINVASRVLTRPCFLATETIFELIQDIIRTNLLTNVNKEKCPAPGGHVFQPTSTIFELVHDIIGMNLLTKFHEDRTINVASRLKNAPPLAAIVLTRKTALPPGGHVFSPIWTILELVRDINDTNVLTKFHDDWAKIVTSRVFTRNTAPPPGGHLHEDWTSNVSSTVFTSFELSRGINGTNVLTKFHEDRTINVTSRVFTRQMLTAHDARRTKDDHKSSP
ncbi:hypothetical protein DPMN_116691 [Dreissena polymorpha]|uniref:Uncharacterized protein n=1 Tax=Dreissena polymorpha TaxID=45954 RepID=A0A9D4QTM6_DREPO|nr:hypothetical protein DPMN_116691 [Dreissena polymorpha]